MKKTKTFKAFTLAEVLITLAIIGVVAALTIPTVVTNYKAKALETQKKKAMSVLANGFKLLMAEDDVTLFQNTRIANCANGVMGFKESCYPNEIKRVFNVVSDNNSSNEVFNIEYQFDWGSMPVRDYSPYAFVTSDGMIFYVYLGGAPASGTATSIDMIVDLNGMKNPNRGGQDLCKFNIDNHGGITDHCTEMANWGEPEEPTCDSSHHANCKNQADCEAAGGNWDEICIIGGPCTNTCL